MRPETENYGFKEEKRKGKCRLWLKKLEPALNPLIRLKKKRIHQLLFKNWIGTGTDSRAIISDKMESEPNQ
jgi:hypothetical protein